MTDLPIFLDGPAGRLEARLRGDSLLSPVAAALLLPPHPLHGGSLHNKTLFRLAKALVEAGVPSLRLNYRGVGQSQGGFDGQAESLDASAALDWLAQRFPTAPAMAVGYSFGAAIGLRQVALDPRLTTFVALGLPIALEFDLRWLHHCARAGCFVQGERDEYGNCEQLRAFLRPLQRSDEIECIAGADHLFRGREDAAVAAVLRYIGRTFGGTRTRS